MLQRIYREVSFFPPGEFPLAETKKGRAFNPAFR